MYLLQCCGPCGVQQYCVSVVILCCVVLKDEDEVPDDETINQMLARTEAEYEKFQVDFLIFYILYFSTRVLIKFVSFIVANIKIFIIWENL